MATAATQRKRKAAQPELPATEAPPRIPDWSWEERAWAEGWRVVAGVDEAGRGPLAGPVVAAAVILPARLEIVGVNDSKCLAPEAREVLYALVTGAALAWSFGSASPAEIDEINILRATHLAMARALAGLRLAVCGALVDGLPVKGLPCPHRAIVGGDGRSVSIAAASIIAKVTRDRQMVELDARHPEYGFARHKGYSTPEHLRSLKEHGPCPHHRRSFQPVASAEASVSFPGAMDSLWPDSAAPALVSAGIAGGSGGGIAIGSSLGAAKAAASPAASAT